MKKTFVIGALVALAMTFVSCMDGLKTGAAEPETPANTTDLVMFEKGIFTNPTSFVTKGYDTFLELPIPADLTGYKYLNVEFKCEDMKTATQVVLVPKSTEKNSNDTVLHEQGSIPIYSPVTEAKVMQTKFGTTYGKYTDYNATGNPVVTITDNMFAGITVQAQDGNSGWAAVDGVEVIITKVWATNEELK